MSIRFLKWSELKTNGFDWNNVLISNLVMEWLEQFHNKTRVKACTLVKYMDSIKLAVEFLGNYDGIFVFL